jgi:glycosyltransferase involved in cell wall biosynthesis
LNKNSAADAAYSVVIPAFDAAATLEAAIASLRRQTQSPRRIIVVDDGSRDATAAVARGCGEDILVMVQANAGPGAATNRGMAAVDTPLVAFLDADDLWLPHKAAAQIDLLAGDPTLDGVCGLGRQFFDGRDDAPDGKVQELWSRTSLMIRTARMRAVGPVIDPPGRRGDLVDWLARARDAGLRIEMQQQVVALRRVRPGSLSFGRSASDAGYLHVVKAALDRKRAQAAKNRE